MLLLRAWLACGLVTACAAASLSCSRTGLRGGFGAEEDVIVPPATGGAGTEEPNEQEPMSMPRLPELSIAARLQGKEDEQLSMVAPLTTPRGPFTLDTGGPYTLEYAPGGARFAYGDAAGIRLVDEWPPEPELLEGTEDAWFTWLDAERLLVQSGAGLLLYDARTRALTTLFEATLGQEVYLHRASPDARWVAFAVFWANEHQVWVLDLEESPLTARFVQAFDPGVVLAWFDWAPDSQHLGYVSAKEFQLVPYSVSTTASTDLTPTGISMALNDSTSIPDFQWAPDGKSLHFYYQELILDGTMTDERLYWVDMSEVEPQEPILLTDFAERYWTLPGKFSPKSDTIAFYADFASPYRTTLFVSRFLGAPLAPVIDFQLDVEAMKLEWAPSGDALYFTTWDGVSNEKLYKSDLHGFSKSVSKPGADVRGVFVSPEENCIAYSQFLPEPGVIVVNEARGLYTDVGNPEANNPDWSGTFDSSSASWASDSRGLRGLVYVTQDSEGHEALAWAEVNDCVPTAGETLMQSTETRGIDGYSISTEPPMEQRR